MKISPDMIKVQEFQVQNKRRQLTQLDHMIDEFEKMIKVLTEQIVSQEYKSTPPPHAHFAHANIVKAACLRRDNLQRSLEELKEQREKAAAELAEIEANHQTIEQFLKSGNRFSDKNCGKNKKLEQSVEPSETKTALVSRRRSFRTVTEKSEVAFQLA